jgi:hypothetical protein
MIQIGGSAQRSFVFPANLRDAFACYRDIGGSFRFLPYISLVHRYAAGQYRLLYSSLESGLYRVKIFCDVLAAVEEDRYLIRISPFEGDSPVRAQAGLYSMTGQGFYNSEIHFTKCGDQTRIEYSIEMKASLPVPFTLRWIPDGLMEGIAQHHFYLHMDEVIDRFIEGSVQAYGTDPRQESPGTRSGV